MNYNKKYDYYVGDLISISGHSDSIIEIISFKDDGELATVIWQAPEYFADKGITYHFNLFNTKLFKRKPKESGNAPDSSGILYEII